jgi:hypothetical protein
VLGYVGNFDKIIFLKSLIIFNKMKFFDSNEYEIFKSSISENISSLIVDFG